MRHPSMARVAAMIALATLACADADTADGRGEDLATWGLGAEDVRIGAVDDPEFAYGPVMQLAVDPQGRLHSIHAQEAQVRRWTADGRSDLILGRQGEGPGEFTDVRRMGFFGDSLWVMDGRAYRVTFFGPDGAVLGTLTPQVDLGGEAPRNEPPPRPTAPLRSGGFYARAPAWSDAIARGEMSRSLHTSVDVQGETRDTVFWQPHTPVDLLALLNPDGVGGTFSPQPFADDVLLDVDPVRERLLVVERRAWSGSGPAEFTVTAIAMTGDTLWRRGLPYDPHPLDGSVIDSIVTERATNLHRFMSRFQEGLTVAALEEDLHQAVYRPAYLPPVTGMLMAGDGAVWLALADVPGATTRTWLVLDEAGEPLARLEAPSDLRIMSADGTHVWGVVRDELDVDYLVRRPVLPG